MISQNPGEFFRFAQQALPVLFFSAAMLFAIVCNSLWYGGATEPHGQRIKAMRLGAQSIYLGVKVGL